MLAGMGLVLLSLIIHFVSSTCVTRESKLRQSQADQLLKFGKLKGNHISCLSFSISPE